MNGINRFNVYGNAYEMFADGENSSNTMLGLRDRTVAHSGAPLLGNLGGRAQPLSPGGASLSHPAHTRRASQFGNPSYLVLNMIANFDALAELKHSEQHRELATLAESALKRQILRLDAPLHIRGVQYSGMTMRVDGRKGRLDVNVVPDQRGQFIIQAVDWANTSTGKVTEGFKIDRQSREHENSVAGLQFDRLQPLARASASGSLPLSQGLNQQEAAHQFLPLALLIQAQARPSFVSTAQRSLPPSVIGASASPPRTAFSPIEQLPSAPHAAAGRLPGIELSEQDHESLMSTVPKHTMIKGKLKMIDRSSIRGFLRYLERKNVKWSQLVSQGAGPRPLELENEVNEAIANKGVRTNARNAINQAFDLALQGQKALQCSEHVMMMDALSTQLGNWHYRHVKMFLRYLERRGTKWSDLMHGETECATPPDLKSAIDEGIAGGESPNIELSVYAALRVLQNKAPAADR